MINTKYKFKKQDGRASTMPKEKSVLVYIYIYMTYQKGDSSGNQNKKIATK